MANKHHVLDCMQSELLQNFSELRSFLVMLKPKSEADKVWIDLFIDMMNQLISDVKEAEDLADLSEWFNLNNLLADWDHIESNLTRPYTSDVNNLIRMICDNYETGIEEYISTVGPKED